MNFFKDFFLAVIRLGLAFFLTIIVSVMLKAFFVYNAFIEGGLETVQLAGIEGIKVLIIWAGYVVAGVMVLIGGLLAFALAGYWLMVNVKLRLERKAHRFTSSGPLEGTGGGETPPSKVGLGMTSQELDEILVQFKVKDATIQRLQEELARERMIRDLDE